MRTFILALAVMVVGVFIIPAAGAHAALSLAPGHGVAATDAHVLEAQQLPDVNIEVHTADDGGRWYEDPVWVAIAVLGLLLAIVLIVMASRGGGTTVLKT